MTEIEDVLLDIDTLHVMMERLDGDDRSLRAIASVLADRQARLAELERIAAEA